MKKYYLMLLSSFLLAGCSEVSIEEYKSFKKDELSSIVYTIKNPQEYDRKLFIDTIETTLNDLDNSSSIKEIDTAYKNVDKIEKMVIEKSKSNDILDKYLSSLKLNKDVTNTRNMYSYNMFYYGTYNECIVLYESLQSSGVNTMKLHNYDFGEFTGTFSFVYNETIYNPSVDIEYIEKELISKDDSKTIYDIYTVFSEKEGGQSNA